MVENAYHAIKSKNNNYNHINIQVLMDEIKIINGIVYNSNNNSIIGLEDEEMDFDHVIKTLSNINYNEYKHSKPGQYISQYYIRGIENSFTYPVEYYVVNKSCSGTELKKQLINVIKNLETANFRVHAVVLDAGGIL